MPFKTKSVSFKPGEGGLDSRSDADEVDVGQWRFILNIGAVAKKKRTRISGWDKLLTKSDYNNQDLHNQLLSTTGFPARQPFVFLYESESTRKSTRLIAGTHNALYVLNVGTGNWKVISNRMGSTNTRWRAAHLNDITIFTNNFDPPVHWFFDQGVTEANNQSVAPIPDLAKIGITKVGTIVTWMGHIFAFNVVQDGTVFSGRALWSNYQRPLEWQPNAGSTAGSSDVMVNETVLNAMPLSNRLLVFTNRGIWEVTAVGGEAVFAISKRYEPIKGEACLFYPNTLCSKGDELIYAGIDGIYTYSLYQQKPARVDWMHKSSNLMFDYINREACEVTIACYNSQLKELYFSYARNDEQLPSETIVFNTEYPWAYVVDHGFSAIVQYVAKTQSKLIRDFLLEKCICTAEGLKEIWGDFTMEGGYCPGHEPPPVTCAVVPKSIYTTTPATIVYQDESVVTEDFDKTTEDADSLCAVMSGQTLAELCESEARQDECSAGLRFVLASSQDWALKELSLNYYREMLACTNDPACFNGCEPSLWRQKGYRSMLRSGPISGGELVNDKEISRLALEASAVPQGTPSVFGLRIGRHSQAVDPNRDDCGIVWDDQEKLPIECLGVVPAATHIAENTIPDGIYNWPLYYTGMYLYFELTVENPNNVEEPDTGGAVSFSRITVDMRPQTNAY